MVDGCARARRTVFATLEVKIELDFLALCAYNAKYLYNKEA